MAKQPKTETEEDILREEIFAIVEMAKTPGWQALKKRADKALESIKNQKTGIVTEIEGRYLSDTVIARQVVALEHREAGIKAILNEVTHAIKQAEKLTKEAEAKDKAVKK